MSGKISKNVIIIICVLIVFIVFSVAAYYYYIKKTNNDTQITGISLKLKELPELEKDIFSKCMEKKEGVSQDIAFCQENTQKQMHDLAQDLTNAKKNLQGKNWYEVLQ